MPRPSGSADLLEDRRKRALALLDLEPRAGLEPATCRLRNGALPL